MWFDNQRKTKNTGLPERGRLGGWTVKWLENERQEMSRVEHLYEQIYGGHCPYSKEGSHRQEKIYKWFLIQGDGAALDLIRTQELKVSQS